MSALRTYPDSEALAKAAAELFVTLAQEALAARGQLNVALSGGSTPKAMYRSVVALTVGAVAAPGTPSQSRLDWARIHVFWGDDRCVPPDHPDSNYRLARETLLDHVPIPPGNVHRIRTEADPEEAAAEYEEELRAFFRVGQASSLPRFDLILLGMGDDGHTASLFPGAAALHHGEHWVAAVEHTTPPPPLVARVTFTPVLINAAAHVVFLVAGAGKAERLRQVLKGPYQPDRLPAQIVRPAGGKLLWLVDEAAAGNL